MTFLDPFFWLYFLYFIVAVVVAFFIPGDVFAQRLQRPFFQRVVIATVFGMVLWSIQGYVFGYIQMRWLSYLYMVILGLMWIRDNRAVFTVQRSFPKIRIDWMLLVMFIGGVSIQFISAGFNGITYQNSLHFCCSVPDSLYHIALVNALVQQVPPFEPGMYDTVVKNYHYLGNLCVAELIRVFKLPLLYTQNQYITVFLSLFIGLSAVTFAQVLKLRTTFTRWFVFFLYFYGDSIFLISSLLGNGINFTYTLQENAGTLWTSPPRVFAMVIFLIGVTLLYLWIKKRNFSTGILMAILMGSLVGFKVYIGIFAFAGLGILGCYYLLKREGRMLIPLFIAVILCVILYIPTNSGAGGIFFGGLWRIEDFIVNPAYDLSRLELARRIYLEHANYLRVAQYEIMYILLYIPSLLGIFLLGFLQTKKSLRHIPVLVHLYLLFGVCISTVLGVFFLQEVGGANTSQFLFPLYIVGALYTALTCSVFLESIKKPIKIFIILLIISITVGRVLYTTQRTLGYIIQDTQIRIGAAELEGLTFLKDQTPKSSILFLADKRSIEANDSYYISFLADRSIFLGGAGILNDHGMKTQKKMQISEGILFDKNAANVGTSLIKSGIDYLYLKHGQSLVSTKSAYFLTPVLKNDTITILKVEKEKISEYLSMPGVK